MTKEEILNQCICDHPFQGLDEEEKSIALNAMDEYAKQECIDFLMFYLANMYNEQVANCTNEKLYELYLQQKK